MNAETGMRQIWHEVFHPVNVEAFASQMEVFDRMRETHRAARAAEKETEEENES